MSFPAAAQSDLLGLHQRSACARYNRKPGLLRVFYALLFCRLGHHFFEGVHRAEAVIIDGQPFSASVTRCGGDCRVNASALRSCSVL